MRALSLLTVIALVVSGCTSPASKEDLKWRRETAVQLGITRDEVAEIAQLAVANGKLVVVGMMKKDGEVIEIYLGTSAESGSGPLVRVHKVAGKWLMIEDGQIAIWLK